MIYKKLAASGFTLAEIIISILLLSIVAVGSFKTFHYAQFSANSAFTQYLVRNEQRQRSALEKLKVDYPLIHTDPNLPVLKCAVEQDLACSLTQQ